MEEKRVFVTGGEGFIGSHLADRLIENGHNVTIIDNLPTGEEESLNPKTKFYNLNNRRVLKELGWISDHNFDRGLKETVVWLKEK